MRLFNRTNCSVTVTEAGKDLLARLETGFGAIEEGLEELNRYRGKPAGRLRIDVLTDAARLVLGPALTGFLAQDPEVTLEIVVQDDFVDIVGGGFDAGIRFGGRVPEEMIAVAIGPALRWIMVAAPDYLAAAPRLRQPSGLSEHRCIGFRMGTGAIYHWELERGAEKLTVTVEWAVIVSETALAIEIAETGGGIAYCQEGRVERQLAATILAIGASGTVGTALLDLARRFGLTAIGTCSAANVRTVERYGAAAVDYRAEDFVVAVRRLTAGREGGSGVDAAFDAIGGAHFARSFACLARGGLLVGYGSQTMASGAEGLASAALGLARLKPRHRRRDQAPEATAAASVTP